MLIENGAVRLELLELMRLQGWETPHNLTPQWINTVLQLQWVKAKDGVFRAQLGGRFPTEGEMVLLRQLGADAIPINFSVPYGGTLLLGATLKAIVRRVWFMLQQERHNPLVPRPVYLLGSGRELDVKQEMPAHIQAILEETGARFSPRWNIDDTAAVWPRIEIDMMTDVLDWMAIYGWNRQIIWAPDGQKPDGTVCPANTAETIKEWLKSAPVGHYLIVSSQPFCEGQKMAVERAVRETGAEGYTFDVCGPAAPPLPLSRWLDNLAKQLWEEVQLLPS